MPAKKAQRLDTLLVTRGLAESREKAQGMIRAGDVRVNSALSDKPGRNVPTDAEIVVRVPERYVSRGGLKIEAALREFAIDVRGMVALDVGASTGGFTDCLLQYGVARVIAVDVGRGQLHDRLRRDPRVTSIERLNARYLDQTHVLVPVDLVVMDVSFISLRLTMPPATACLKNGGFLITLIKPQFEAGPRDVQRGGVVRDAAVHARVVDDIRGFGEATLGLCWHGVIESPLRGPAGNIEFLALWEKP